LIFDPIAQRFPSKEAAISKAAAIIREQPSVSSLQTVEVIGRTDAGIRFVGVVQRNLSLLVSVDTTSNEP